MFSDETQMKKQEKTGKKIQAKTGEVVEKEGEIVFHVFNVTQKT